MNQFPTQQLYTERVYIDPERLIQLKKQRKPFKHVPSIFEPPPQQQAPSTRQTKPPSLHSYRHSQQQPNSNDILGNQLIGRSNSANVEFVISLMGEVKNQQIVWLQEGDCMTVRTDSRCLILQGSVKVTAVASRAFTLGEGSILFINNQTIDKVREIICTQPTKLLRINENIFKMLRNYLFLKNSEKIKYLKYCPFFLWSEHLSEDIASFMTMEVFEKNTNIYQKGDPADNIYFVKEGVVLLERNQELSSMIFGQYETHYERSQLSSQETTLVVKKGMVFGIDGVLLKDTEVSTGVNKGLQNPQMRSYQEPTVGSNLRVYSAKTIGRTQVYVFSRQILEGLFGISDLLSARNFPRQLSKEDLQRISSDYAQMVVRHRSLPRISQAVSTRQLSLNHEPDLLEDEMQKRQHVRQMRLKEERRKKNSIASIITDSRNNSRGRDYNGSMILQHFYSKKLGMDGPQLQRNHVFPRLTSNTRKKRIMKKNPQIESSQKYVMGWLKCQDPANKHKVSRQPPSIHRTPKKTSDGKERLSLIKVRSYRSIIS